MKKKWIAWLLAASCLTSVTVCAEGTQAKAVTAEEVEAATATKYDPWLTNLHWATDAQIKDGVKGGEGGQICFAVAASLLDADKAVMGNDTTGVYVTVDGAKSWKKAEKFPDGCIEALAYYPLNDDILFAHVSCFNIAGVYRSTDGGHHWEFLKYLENNDKLLGTNHGIVFGEKDPTTGNCPIYTYAGWFEDRDHPKTGSSGLFRSDDLGDTWYSIGGFESTEIMDIWSSPFDNLDLIFVSTDHKMKGLYMSRDGGHSFTPVSSAESGLPYGVNAIAVDPLDPENHWIVSSGEQWSSLSEQEKHDYFMDVLNGMSEWKDKSLEEKEAFIKTIRFDGWRGQIYLDATKCLYETKDGGKSWNVVDSNWNVEIENGKDWGFWDPARRLRSYNTNVLATTDVAILKFSEPYTDEVTGEKKTRLLSQNTYANWTYRYSEDCGKTWRNPPRDSKYDMLSNVSTGWFAEGLATTPADPMRVYSSLGIMYRSDDGGKTFQYANSGIAGALAMDWAFDEEGQLLYVTAMDHGIRTRLPGYEWYKGDYPSTIPSQGYTLESGGALAVDPNDPNHVFTLAGSECYGMISTIAETKDGFKSAITYNGIKDIFTARRNGETDPAKVGIGVGTSVGFVKYSSTNDQVIYSNYFVSEDNGKSWRETECVISAVSPQDGDIVYSVSQPLPNENSMDGKHVYISYDRGRTWNDTGFVFDGIRSNVEADLFEPYVLYLGQHWNSTLWRLDLKNGVLKVINESNGLISDSGDPLQVTSFAQNPNNKDHWAVGVNDFYYATEYVFETYDGGQTFRRLPVPQRIGNSITFNKVKDTLWIGGCSGTWIYDYNLYNQMKANGEVE